MVDMKPWVFSVGPPGSLAAIDHQDRPIVHINNGFGKRKKQAARYQPPFFHQPL
jgi:hypothetical protein